jgi:aldose sugar dehydrogenase
LIAHFAQIVVSLLGRHNSSACCGQRKPAVGTEQEFSAMRLPLLAALLAATPAIAANPGQGLAPTVAATTVFTITPVASFDNPWAMTFLPDGRALVSEKPGRLRVVATNGTVSAPLAGLPPVQYGGQNGLLDVIVHPDFAKNRLVYISFVEPGPGGTSGLAVGYGRYVNNAIQGFRVIFRDPAKTSDGNGHNSGRLVFASDKTLFVTSGERQQATPAQDLTTSKGKVLHMSSIGWALPTAPFSGSATTRKIWSLGHRNSLGMAFDLSGNLWEHENGPEGGDELNLVARGANYGWPTVSNGRNYGSPTDDIPDHDTRPDFAAPKVWWNPSLAPSGLFFYSGSMFPAFRGNAFIGTLAGQSVVRVTISGTTATEAVRYDMGARIREVEQGPDGAIWALEDGGSGRLLKLTPKP